MAAVTALSSRASNPRSHCSTVLWSREHTQRSMLLSGRVWGAAERQGSVDRNTSSTSGCVVKGIEECVQQRKNMFHQMY